MLPIEGNLESQAPLEVTGPVLEPFRPRRMSGERLLIGVALGFLGLFVALPLGNVAVQALALGWGFYGTALANPDTVAALKLTLLLCSIAVPLNVVFGTAAGWAVGKFQFRGRGLLITLIDVPFAISPVVAGLMLVLMFGRAGLLGQWLEDHGVQLLFAPAGMAIATTMITVPLVARELIPLVQSLGTDQEEAALTLGASGWQTFWKVSLPSMKWGILHGALLCNARALGEFGAVSIVSGHITGLTDTLPLRIEKLYQGASLASGVAAFGAATVLAAFALGLLGLKAWWEAKESETAERS